MAGGPQFEELAVDQAVDMSAIDAEPVVEAVRDAELILGDIGRRGDLVPVWAAFEVAIARYEQETGGTIGDLLPEKAKALAIRVPGRARAEELARRLLCDDLDRLRELLGRMADQGINGLALALLALLRWPIALAYLLGPLLALLLARGIGRFCAASASSRTAAAGA